MRALAQVPIFRGLLDGDLTSLAAMARRRSYRRGEFVTVPDQDVREILIIVAGGARVYRLSASGNEITLEHINAPDLFGLIFLNEAVLARSFMVATSDETVVFHVPPAEIRVWLIEHPQVAVESLARISTRLADARDRLADLALYDVKTRLAHTLAKLAAANPNHEILVTHEGLARIVGARQEEITRALRQFRTQGLVRYRPHQRGMMVPDVDRLARYETEIL
jgi:CRP/FNR family cyclic AMP-dependent transcriptional regulator